MASKNLVILIGNVTGDPDARTTPNGKKVTTFSVATNYKDTAEFHNIVAWEKQAEVAENYLTKGKQVYIEGRLQTRQWTDKNENKRYTTEIIAYQILMLGAKSDKPREEAVETAAPTKPEEEDDIPW